MQFQTLKKDKQRRIGNLWHVKALTPLVEFPVFPLVVLEWEAVAIIWCVAIS